jgi:hypothetical protein
MPVTISFATRRAAETAAPDQQGDACRQHPQQRSDKRPIGRKKLGGDDIGRPQIAGASAVSSKSIIRLRERKAMILSSLQAKLVTKYVPTSILISRQVSTDGQITAIDAVDRILAQWQRERPDLDCSPMGPIGRLKRCAMLLEPQVEVAFTRHDLVRWEFDMLATLRRAGAPFFFRRPSSSPR